MKKMVEVGYKILLVNEKEMELLNFLSDNNLLKHRVKEISVFDSDGSLEKIYNAE